jgi:lysophospholipase L1-like esterase
MPLTETNIKLMPDGLYDKYRTMLRDISAKNNISLLDLTKQKYKDDYFYDTVHLNDAGAEPFLTSLNKSIREEQAHSSLASRSLKSL